MDEFYYPDELIELEIGLADYGNATFKPKKLKVKGLKEFIEVNYNENTSKKTALDCMLHYNNSAIYLMTAVTKPFVALLLLATPTCLVCSPTPQCQDAL